MQPIEDDVSRYATVFERSQQASEDTAHLHPFHGVEHVALDHTD
jgi:hypothetical protein